MNIILYQLLDEKIMDTQLAKMNFINKSKSYILKEEKPEKRRISFGISISKRAVPEDASFKMEETCMLQNHSSVKNVSNKNSVS